MVKKIEWFFNRLRMMSFWEILMRVRTEVKAGIEALIGKAKKPRAFYEHIIKRVEGQPIFPFPARAREEYAAAFRAQFPHEAAQTVEDAARIIAHSFRFLGYGPVRFGERIAWTASFENGAPWPLSSWTKIDYRLRPERGEIKLPWELSRHQYFLVLGKAYWLTGDEKYALEFTSQVSSWMAANPRGKGINWIVKLDMGIRMISWMWTYLFFKDSPCFTKEVKLLVLESMFEQTRHIAANLSYGSSANNHLIGQAAALFLVGVFFTEQVSAASRWRKKGLDVLATEVDKQVCDDGFLKEQSASYHAFVLDFLLLMIAAARFNHIPLPPPLEKKIRLMCESLTRLKRTFAAVPRVGDADEGQAVKFRLEERQNYEACLSTAAVLFGSGCFKAAAGGFDEKSFWLLGPAGLRDFLRITAVEESLVSCLLPESGYGLLTSDAGGKKTALLFDCGPVGYGKPAGHGHADALSFVLEANGESILVDPGAYSYGKPDWRAYFRGTAAHNTVRVDHRDQSLAGGAFIWLKKARSYVTHWESDDDHDLVRAYHTGYERLDDPVRHEREIAFDKTKNVITIYDAIAAKKSHAVEQHFHLAPGVELIKIAEKKYELRGNTASAVITVDQRCACEAVRGRHAPLLGWYSPSYGVLCEAWCLRTALVADGACRLATIIQVKA